MRFSDAIARQLDPLTARSVYRLGPVPLDVMLLALPYTVAGAAPGLVHLMPAIITGLLAIAVAWHLALIMTERGVQWGYMFYAAVHLPVTAIAAAFAAALHHYWR